jgi:hypothetical protein
MFFVKRVAFKMAEGIAQLDETKMFINPQMATLPGRMKRLMSDENYTIEIIL